jgi:hypothetical protein
MSVPTEQALQTARKIVADLFVNGNGDEAHRLVLMTADGRDLGGWCRQSVVDRIAEGISKASEGRSAGR